MHNFIPSVQSVSVMFDGQAQDLLSKPIGQANPGQNTTRVAYYSEEAVFQADEGKFGRRI